MNDKPGYCQAHENWARKLSDEGRQARGDTAAARGYGSAWQKARKAYLTKNPLCVHCTDKGRLTPANTVDHVIAHKGDKKLFWDSSNWQALCAPCHSIKTAKEDGGFGR